MTIDGELRRVLLSQDLLFKVKVPLVLSGWAQSTFLALENRNFRLLFFGTAFAQLTFAMKNVVQGIVAFELTGRNSSVGLVALGMGVTLVIFGPLGGALGDRLPKRQLLLVSQSIIGVTFAVVGVLIITDAITMWLLVLSTLGLGSMFAIMGPTRQAWIGELLSGRELANGIALQQIAMNGTRIIGPFLVGVLVTVAFVGAGGTYLAMAGVFGIVVAMLWLMPTTGPVRPSGRSVIGDLTEGVRYISRSAELRLLTSIFAGTVITAFSYQTLLPGFLEHELGRPAKELGILYGAAAVGGLLVTLVLAGRAASSTLSFMFVVGGLLGLSLLTLSVAPNLLVALVAMTAVGAFSSAFQLLNNVNLMRRCEPEFYGRVMSVTMMSFGLMSVAAYPIGITADSIGERSTLVGCGCAALLMVAAGLVASRRIPRQVPAAAAHVLEESGKFVSGSPLAARPGSEP